MVSFKRLSLPLALALSGALLPLGAPAASAAPAAPAQVSAKVTSSPRLSASQIRARQVAALQGALVSTAASKAGLAYRWGGTSPARGFDCSGFTQWVYKSHGINLPRTTSQQAKKGKAVSLKTSRPGDLIFTNSGGHVGIVAEAGGKSFWHSPRTGRSISKDQTRWYKVSKVVRVVS